MSATSEQPIEQPWYTEETDTRLLLCHDHRWLRFIGIPLAIGCASLAIALWFLPDLNYDRDWPILAVGSLIATGFALIGLHLSFNRIVFTADSERGILVRSEGFGVFTRTKCYELDEIQSVSVVKSNLVGSPSTSYRLELNMVNGPIGLASFVFREPLDAEASRWRRFLGLSES